MNNRIFILLSISVLTIILCGCSDAFYQVSLMARPNVYTPEEVKDPFAETPPVYATNPVEVFYVTDRVPIDPKDNKRNARFYGGVRSDQMSFGSASVVMGKGLSWDELKNLSLQEKRKKKVEVYLQDIIEVGRSPRVPRDFYEHEMEKETGDPEAYQKKNDTVSELVKSKIDKRMNEVNSKEIYLFLHGVNTTFEQGIIDWSQLWHFLGRKGVPIIYCWPASAGGLTGYFTDSDSGDASVGHLKKAIRLFSEVESVEKINIIAHSRGTDIASKALMELAMTNQAKGLPAGHRLKLNNIVLIAPDIDEYYFVQRVIEQGVLDMPKQFSIYLSTNDRALGLSQWLRSGLSRLGMVKIERLSPEQIRRISSYKNANGVISLAKPRSWTNHSYYLESPSVSSDLVLLLRYNLAAGKDNGRPLKEVNKNLWDLNEGYPFKNYKLPASQ